MNIMSVDDSKAVHAFMKAIFDGSVHKLFHAYDGKQALELVKENTPDLILLDWEMPEMDGLTTLKALRQQGLTIPIVMVTSRNNVDQMISAMSEGADEYVMKPFTKELLFDKLSMVLGTDLAS